MSGEVEISTGRARVVVEATIYGTYESAQVADLRLAVIRACRAIGSDDALQLAADVQRDSR